MRQRNFPFLVLLVMPALLLLSRPFSGTGVFANGSRPVVETNKKLPATKLAQANRPPASRSAAAIAVMDKGRKLLDKQQIAEALSLFQDYCRNWPQDAKGYFWMGICYDEMGNLPFAAQAYRDGITKAEQNGMDSCELRVNLGNVLLKESDLDPAIESFKRAIEINPQYELAYLNLGRAYIAKADFQSALQVLAKCEDLRFKSPQLLYYKAKALLGLGRKEEAGALISRFLQDIPPGNTRTEIQQEFASCLQK